MTRRLVLQLALSLSLVAAAGAPVVAAIAPLPPLQTAPTQLMIGESNPSLVELSYERLLEESLQQSLAAYLGPDNFVLQVRVAIAHDPTVPQQVAPAQPVQAPQVQVPAQPAAEDAPVPEADFDSIPALPGLGMPAEERTRRPVRQAPAMQMPAPQMPQVQAPAPQAPVAQVVSSTPRIERIRVSLVLPSSLQSTDEDYVKNLVFQRADLNFARGDTLDIARRDFPRTAGTVLPGSVPSKSGGLPPWLWAIIGALGASALFGGALLLRRRPEPQVAPAAPSLPVQSENMKAAEALLASVSASKAAEPPPMRQDLLVMLLERPEIGERYLKRLLSEEGGLEKAATFSQAMGLGVARRLFTGMHANEWKAIELAALDQTEIKREDQQAALEEALYAMLRAQTEQQGSDKTAPFAFLQTLDDSQILFMLEEEGPRVQALVLSQLPPDRAVGLMRLKTPAEQGAIAAAMGELHLLPMSSFIDLAHHMAEKATKAPSFQTPVTNGLGLLVNLLDHSDRATEQGILSGLSTQNPRLLAQVREAYLTFDDLAKVPRDVLKDALREVDKESLAEALRDAPDKVRDAIVASLTERARRIVDDVLSQPPVVRQ
ncbi:MAG TPA: FliG C-terminal domain-containing protein, partial [Stenomitos sp.]